MSEDLISNNKRIAKNTLFLYIRTFVTLLISLYTSRVILKALGVEDYGIYNVVGGFVSMFSLLSGALSNAISRFITFELGRDDKERLNQVFCTSVTIQIMLALGIIIIAEIVGVWFLNTKMVIPDGRIIAANWVFQCSLLTFGIKLISIPYNACIIAHEKMNTFAYVSVLEAGLKLGAVLLLFYIGFDRLVVYAILVLLLAIFIRLFYGFYCTYHFEECKYRLIFRNDLIKEMTGVAGWNMLGSSGAVLNNHGVNLLMNLFFGVKVNAARGLANQVNSAVTQFVNSFTTAVNPQITKSYAKGDKAYNFNLVMMSSKYSFFLMLCLAAPIFVETPFLLKIWLKLVPENTVMFVRLTLVISLINTLSTSLYTLALATGNIKKYQIVVGSLSLSCFVVTYLCYKLGCPVESAYYANIVIQLCIMVSRLNILASLTGLNIRTFFNKVIIKVLQVVSIVALISYLINKLLPDNILLNILFSMVVIIFGTLITILVVGLEKKERDYFMLLIKKKRFSDK